jgi:hypothetical protein
MTHCAKYELWLEAGYEYYVAPNEFDLPIMSDYDYDRLSEELLNTFDEWDHPLKYLVCEDDLRCGSGFAIKWADWLVYKQENEVNK